jgi:hypothetical protein
VASSEKGLLMVVNTSSTHVSATGWTPLHLAAGAFSFQVFAPTLQSVTVQATDDFSTWTDVAQVPIGANRVGYFSDTGVANSASLRFYRVKF